MNPLDTVKLDKSLRVVMVSKALVTGAYQRKAEEIARLGVELTVFTPPYWRDRRGTQVAEAAHTQGYELRTLPARCIGDYHLHYYPGLAAALKRIQPHVLHMDEEPYNLATWLGLRAAERLGIAPTFFTWQNLDRTYPYPFRRFEQENYGRAPIAIAGSHDATKVLRAKGYTGEVAVIPQFGVDTEIFSPASERPAGDGLRIGYAGALLPEKGIDLLLEACAALKGAWHLTLVGEGESEAALRKLAGSLGIAERVTFRGKVASAAMPAVYQQWDVLVLASRTLPNWKEQFGRVLIEAMATGVVPVCSDSGEMPHVVGTAGLVFPEGDAHALAAHLQRLADLPEWRTQLAAAGRERVLAHYTMAAIARDTVEVYRRLAVLL